MSKKVVQEDKELEVFVVHIDDIVLADYNPRKITPKKKQELIDSIKKYGLIEPLKINTFEGRENVLISGHQRIKIARDLGISQIPVTKEYLNLEDEMELNIRLNKNGGEFDMVKLVENIGRSILLDVGFTDNELTKVLSTFEQKFADIDISDPVYPIVPKFNEKYDFIMILAKTEMDYRWMTNLFELQKKQDYKSQNIGECRVLMIEDFQKLYEKWIEQK